MFEGLSVMIEGIGREIGATVDSAIRSADATGDKGITLGDLFNNCSNENNNNSMEESLYCMMGGGDCKMYALIYDYIINKCIKEGYTLDPDMAEQIAAKIGEKEKNVRDALTLRRQILFLNQHGISDNKEILKYARIAESIQSWSEQHDEETVNVNLIAEKCGVLPSDVTNAIKILDEYGRQYLMKKPFTYEQQPPQQQKQPTTNAKKSNSKQQQQAAQQ